MRKLVWSSDPAHPRDERRDLAFEAWRGAAEYLRPDLFATNDRLDEINEIYAAFHQWWKGQIDQCLYVTAAAQGDGYWSCVLPAGHDEAHCANGGACVADGDHLPWVLPDQLAWRQRRIKQQP